MTDAPPTPRPPKGDEVYTSSNIGPHPGYRRPSDANEASDGTSAHERHRSREKTDAPRRKMKGQREEASWSVRPEPRRLPEPPSYMPAASVFCTSSGAG